MSSQYTYVEVARVYDERTAAVFGHFKVCFAYEEDVTVVTMGIESGRIE